LGAQQLRRSLVEAQQRTRARVSFHALRHTHASYLLHLNVDPVTISKRLGHSSPAVTLSIYAHLIKQDDRKAANAINAALKG
jgi:integrase